MNISLSNRNFDLLYEKALYDPEQKLLVIADVHLGKAAHFRKEGIAIPAHAQKGDYRALETLFNKLKPRQVYFLGDLFHSVFNNDWLSFCDMVKEFNSIQFVLIKGNHDIIDHNRFRELCIDVVDYIEEDDVIFSHEPMKQIPDGKTNICGHIHPGISLSGAGKQHLKIPCFYLYQHLFVLPAFGVLTGLYPMKKNKGAKAFGVLSDSVIRVF